MSDTSTRLAQLESVAAAAHASAVKVKGQELDFALRAGIALLEIIEQRLVRHGQRKDLFERTCSSDRTGQLYVWLAKNRNLLLDAANPQRVADLGVREAIRRINKAKGAGRGRREESAESKAPNLSGYTDAEIAAGLERLGFSRFTRVIPTSFRPLLERHAGQQVLRREQSRHPNTKLKNVNLRLVADNPEPPPPITH